MRILADTSVWVDHFRRRSDVFESLLHNNAVLIHPFVIGELLLGGLPDRAVVAADLRRMPRTVCADDDEVLHLIEHHRLHGRGIGYLDAHLLAATRLTKEVRLWTLDRQLDAVARDLGLAASPGH